MLAVSTWHATSSVSHAIKCQLHSKDKNIESLVVAKVNRLEVYDLLRDGLVKRASFDVWGTVTSLAAFKRPGKHLASLLVTTDHLRPYLLVLDFDPTSSVLAVTNSAPLFLPSARPSEYYNGATIHPSGRVVVSLVYTGTVRVLVLGDNANVVSEFDCRIPELTVHSICFLASSDTRYTLAILYEDHTEKRRIVARDLDIEEKELSFESSPALQESTVQDDAETLIPLSFGRKGGLLVCGGALCRLFMTEYSTKEKRSSGKRASRPSLQAPVSTNLPLLSPIAYTRIDEYRIAVADSDGRFGLLVMAMPLVPQTNQEMSINYAELGVVAPSSCIAHISGPTFFIGSHYGDSQIIQVAPDDPKGSCKIGVLESFTNLAPIMDAILADPENSGQPQVVTCSGGHTTGSLRLIRSGAEFKVSAKLQSQQSITSIFALESIHELPDETLMLVSTPFDTRVWRVNVSGRADELSKEDLAGFSRSRPTLAACVLLGGQYIIQVTTTEIVVVRCMTDLQAHRWPPSKNTVEIVAASVNPTQVVIALRGGKLMLFSTKDISDEVGPRIVSEKQLDPIHGLSNEISALSINPALGGNTTSSNIVAVGFWSCNAVTVFRLPDFQHITEDSDAWVIEEPHVARSVLLHSFGSASPYLLVGLADGTVVMYLVTSERLQGRKVFSLGPGSAIKLFPCSYGDAGSAVLAVGDRAEVISLEKGRLRHSSVAIKNVSAVANLNGALGQPSLICATFTGKMVIGRIGELNKLNIRTIPLGHDQPQRIAYHSQFKIYGVGCLNVSLDPSTGVETDSSSTKFFDALTLEFLSAFPCEPGEQVISVQSLSLSTLNQGDSDDHSTSTHFVIGTAKSPAPGNQESTEGRILVFGGSNRDAIHLIASADVPGCVYSLADLNGRLAAAVNTCVLLFQLQRVDSSSPLALKEVAQWNRGYLINSAVSKDDVLIIADALRSVDVLKLDGATNKLEAVARDHTPLWPVSIQTIGNQMIIGAEVDFNLFLMTLADENLECVGGFHLGEMVNKLVPVTNSENGDKVLLFTSSGRIAVVTALSQEQSLSLTALQRNLGYHVKGPNGLKHSDWRTPISSRGTRSLSGFIDGDFIERFLDLDDEQVQEIQQGENRFERISTTKDQIIEIVEQLSAF